MKAIYIIAGALAAGAITLCIILMRRRSCR